MQRLVVSALEVEELVERVARVVADGGTVIFPTDTVYGIGADPMQPDALARIYTAKARPRDKPLSLHFATVAEALEYVDVASAPLVRRLLPGPLTVIVRRPAFVSENVTAGLPTVGLRVPDHPLCSALLERCGPLAATSANVSTMPAYEGNGDAGALPEADVFVDAGPTPRRGESTVIDISGPQPKLVREGVVSLKDIEAILKRTLAVALLVAATALPAIAQNRPAPAPAPKASSSSSTLTNGQFSVETDETNYNLNNGDFEMPHHVHFTRPGTDVTGDRAHGNTRNDTITITGHVVLHQTGAVNSLGAGAQKVTSEEPSTLMTDELQVDGKAKTYTAIGNVHWAQGNKKLSADHGVLNELTHQLNLQGNVHIEQNQQSMDADRVDYDTETEDGKAYGAPVVSRLPVTAPGPDVTSPPAPKPKKGLHKFI
ncbi:MAG TPA: L-threonylcarbamoyladenylate synthase [Candidatus Binatia bacterium]|nr:L-threonylcarbamoyladenylate synthase [Candidatus Binatia bacterium]